MLSYFLKLGPVTGSSSGDGELESELGYPMNSCRTKREVPRVNTGEIRSERISNGHTSQKHPRVGKQKYKTHRFKNIQILLRAYRVVYGQNAYATINSNACFRPGRGKAVDPEASAVSMTEKSRHAANSPKKSQERGRKRFSPSS